MTTAEGGAHTADAMNLNRRTVIAAALIVAAVGLALAGSVLMHRREGVPEILGGATALLLWPIAITGVAWSRGVPVNRSALWFLISTALVIGVTLYARVMLPL